MAGLGCGGAPLAGGFADFAVFGDFFTLARAAMATVRLLFFFLAVFFLAFFLVFFTVFFFLLFLAFFVVDVFALAGLPPFGALSSGSARPSLIAPSTNRSGLASAAVTDCAMTLVSPCTEGMKVRKKIACCAWFIRSNTTLRSGGVAVPLVADWVLGEYQSSTAASPPSVAIVILFDFVLSERSLAPCLLLLGAESCAAVGLSVPGAGILSSRRRFQ